MCTIINISLDLTFQNLQILITSPQRVIRHNYLLKAETTWNLINLFSYYPQS